VAVGCGLWAVWCTANNAFYSSDYFLTYSLTYLIWAWLVTPFNERHSNSTTEQCQTWLYSAMVDGLDKEIYVSQKRLSVLSVYQDQRGAKFDRPFVNRCVGSHLQKNVLRHLHDLRCLVHWVQFVCIESTPLIKTDRQTDRQTGAVPIEPRWRAQRFACNRHEVTLKAYIECFIMNTNRNTRQKQTKVELSEIYTFNKRANTRRWYILLPTW